MKTIVLLLITINVYFINAQITPLKFTNTFETKYREFDIKGLTDDNDFNKYKADLQKLVSPNCNDKTAKEKRECKKEYKMVEEKNKSFNNFNYLAYMYLEYKYHVLKYTTNSTYNKAIASKMSEFTTTSNDPRKIKSEINEIEKSRKSELKAIKDMLFLSQEYKYYHKNEGHFTFFPVHNSTEAQLFYNANVSDKKFQIAENTNFVFSTGGQRVSAMTELYADYFGPIRFSFGSLISNSAVSKTIDSLGNVIPDSLGIQQNSIQEILGGGGNAIFSASYPFINAMTKEGDINFKMMFAPKFSFDLPAIGTSISNASSNTDLGVDASFFYSGAANIMTIFAYSRFAYVMGTSNFYTNLNVDERNGFWLNQLTLGVAFNSMFRVSYSFYYGDKFVNDRFKSMVTFSIIPQ